VVADDPETRRILENTKIISQVKYHEDFEKNIKNKHTPVPVATATAAAFEHQVIENQKIANSSEYKGIKSHYNQTNLITPTTNYVQGTNGNGHMTNGNVNAENLSKTPLIATFKSGIEKQTLDTQIQRKIGSIADYDPLSTYDGGRAGNSNGNGHYYANGNKSNNINRNVYSTGSLSQPKLSQAGGGFNSTSNIIHYNNGSSNGHGNNGHGNNGNGHHAHGFALDLNGHNLLLNNNNNNNFDIPLSDIKTSVYKAIYDYDAKEDDEISFRDGDKFINCEQIDVGWMIGVHEKTGKHGMFPANYAEPVDYF
jgi:hypothetical protein